MSQQGVAAAPGTVARRRRSWAALRARFQDVDPRVRRGYWVWGLVGLTIAVPELWAAVAKPPWPTISGTVGHLEARWNVVAVIVVVAIVVVAYRALPLIRTPGEAAQVKERMLQGAGINYFIPYFAVAVLSVGGGSFVASILSDNHWVLGYVIYGLILVFGIIIPSLLSSQQTTPNAPFAGLFPTIADLEERLHVVALIILTGLVVLLIHLAFYPWPDVFRQHPSIDSP